MQNRQHRAWALVALAIVVAVALAPGRSGAQTGATVSLVNTTGGLLYIPQYGLRPTGATLTAGVDSVTTSIPVSDASSIRTGQIIELQPEIMLVEAVTADGPGGSQDTLTVQRAQLGTAAQSHSAGKGVYADFTRMDVLVSNLTDRATGATLTEALDAGTFEASGGTLVSPINTSASTTTLEVSDASLFLVGRSIRIDSEQMLVQKARRGYQADAGVGIVGDSGAKLASSTDATATTLSITDKTPFTVGCTARIDAEDMLITGVSGDGPGGAADTMFVTRGHNGTTATPHAVNATIITGVVCLTAEVGPFDEVVTISDASRVQSGWVALVDAEEWYVVSATGDGPGAGPDTMTVVREYNGTLPAVHPNGTNVYAGPERIVVQRGYNGTTVASHAAGTPLDFEARVMRVSDDALLGGGSTLGIGSERLQVIKSPAKTLRATGATLASSASAIDEYLFVSDANLIDTAWHVRIGNERMIVSASTPGCDIGTGAAIAEDVDAAETQIDVNDVNYFSPGCTAKLENEHIKVISLSGDGAGGATDNIIVSRAFNGSGAAFHAAGTTVEDGPDSVKVVRGRFGTTAGLLNPGDTIYALTLEPDTVLVSRGADGSPVGAHATGESVYDLDGLGGYRFGVAASAPSSGANLQYGAPASGDDLFITDRGKLQVGAVVVLDEEKMRVMALAGDGPGGSPDVMTVIRGYAGTNPASHAAGTDIRRVVVEFTFGQNGVFLGSTGRFVVCDPVEFGLQTMSVSCGTQQPSPLGAKGSGLLAQTHVSGRATLPSAPQQDLTLFDVVLVDISGDAYQVTPNNARARVVRCPDVTGDRNVTFSGDVITLAKASLGLIPKLPVHDLDGNGSVTFSGDTIAGASVALTTQPQPVRCPPPE